MVIEASSEDITKLFKIPTVQELKGKIKNGYRELKLSRGSSISDVIDTLKSVEIDREIVILPEDFNKKILGERWKTKGTVRKIQITENGKLKRRHGCVYFPFELIYENFSKLKKYHGRNIYAFWGWQGSDHKFRARTHSAIIEGIWLQQFCKSEKTEEKITFDHISCEHEFVAYVPSRSEKNKSYKVTLLYQPLLFLDPLQKYQLYGKEFTIKGKKHRPLDEYCRDACADTSCDDARYHFKINNFQKHYPYYDCAHAIAAREELLSKGKLKFKDLDLDAVALPISPRPAEEHSDLHYIGLKYVARKVGGKIREMTKDMLEAISWNYIGCCGVDAAYQKYFSKKPKKLIKVI